MRPVDAEPSTGDAARHCSPGCPLDGRTATVGLHAGDLPRMTPADPSRGTDAVLPAGSCEACGQPVTFTFDAAWRSPGLEPA